MPAEASAKVGRNVGANGIDVKTLRKHFAEELRTGHDQTRAAVGGAVARAALAGNMAAARYWLSTHGGPQWGIIEGRQVGGLPDGVPILISNEGKVVVYLPDNGRDQLSKSR